VAEAVQVPAVEEQLGLQPTEPPERQKWDRSVSLEQKRDRMVAKIDKMDREELCARVKKHGST
jgi:hypothetical protein